MRVELGQRCFKLKRRVQFQQILIDGVRHHEVSQRHPANFSQSLGKGRAEYGVGKLIEFDLEGVDDPAAEAKKMCEQLLANTVIESYRVEVA